MSSVYAPSNRSVVFAVDFPSKEALAKYIGGISRYNHIIIIIIIMTIIIIIMTIIIMMMMRSMVSLFAQQR